MFVFYHLYRIEQDYQLLYPDVSDRLYAKWGTMADSLIDYATQMFPLWKDVLGLDASTEVNKLTQGTFNMVRMPLVCILLHVSIQPSSRLGGGD